tara:strand:+ start:14326 stop:14655 length:330 start_codon:yes stop_codon:yes gene_type:complete
MQNRPVIKLSNNKYKGEHTYHLNDTVNKRRAALNSEIVRKARVDSITKIEAAKKKKARLNVLRIYRKNSLPRTKKYKECKILTEDMRYIDKRYLKKATTRNICGKKSVP